MAFGDLDGDTDLDAVVANFNSERETVWLNNGTGSCTAGAGSSRPGDLEGDTDLDAVVANDFGQAETVWMNNGAGVFTAHPTPLVRRRRRARRRQTTWTR